MNIDRVTTLFEALGSEGSIARELRLEIFHEISEIFEDEGFRDSFRDHVRLVAAVTATELGNRHGSDESESIELDRVLTELYASGVALGLGVAVLAHDA